MGEITKLFRRPASVTADACFSFIVGAGVGVAAQVFLGFLPFSAALGGAVGGIIGAMHYIRARKNLEKTDPAL